MERETVALSPVGWVREHIEQYEATGGEAGHHLRGRTTALLTVTGRRTGRRHRTGVAYSLIDGEYVVVDANGGSPDRPQWSRNMDQAPGIDLQVGSAALSGTARVATGEERELLWAELVRRHPLYAELQSRTTRQFVIFAIAADAR
jgi:deazaflavin-dependent oxidoreductase (nitroreductase family)